jgi:hypothetical protein
LKAKRATIDKRCNKEVTIILPRSTSNN